METANQRLSNTQLEILKAFRHQLTEEDLQKFRKSVAEFFAEILMDEVDRAWEEQGWDEKNILAC